MVGGIVIEVIMFKEKIWVNTVERDKLDKSDKNQCAIYVERNAISEKINLKDSLWWQGGFAMWTPSENMKPKCGHSEHDDCTRKCGVDYDIQIPRLSYSGVSRPQ